MSASIRKKISEETSHPLTFGAVNQQCPLTDDDPRHGGAMDFYLLGEPALVVDRSGNVIRANSAVQPLLGDNINVRNNRLRIVDTEARDYLQALLEAMSNGLYLSDIEPIVLKSDDGSR